MYTYTAHLFWIINTNTNIFFILFNTSFVLLGFLSRGHKDPK